VANTYNFADEFLVTYPTTRVPIPDVGSQRFNQTFSITLANLSNLNEIDVFYTDPYGNRTYIPLLPGGSFVVQKAPWAMVAGEFDVQTLVGTALFFIAISTDGFAPNYDQGGLSGIAGPLGPAYLAEPVYVAPQQEVKAFVL